MRRAGKGLPIGALVLAVAAAAACSGSGSGHSAAPLVGMHKIRHVVVIMQENRSFDSYFGTYPGADGIPMAKGKPTVCIPSMAKPACVKPYVDHADVNGGGPHGGPEARSAINGGKMNGFLLLSQRY